uniref:Uncharacterized protein n=1 Tax=Pithovirus LCPAC302 TaxID=2506593 RepID=A0A481Z8P7_9VIRU|nr:MAG: uncharacterized protein LCPAC302_01090 [Pithovirus LCPAC302]
MDPHLRAVHNWDKTYIPTEKQAYHEARINGYLFPQIGSDGKIGTLYEEELEAIASHPPIVNLKRYKTYKNMSLDRLKKEFSAVVDIIGPNITEEDLFYYATRGWIPEYDSLNFKIDRWNRYEDLSDIGKQLMDKIYTNKKGYVNKLGHPLEDYIIAFDNNLDNEAAIRSIGERIGISIPPDAYAHDVFYEKLFNHIDQEEQGFQRIKRKNIPTTKKMIDMTEKEYYDYLTANKYIAKDMMHYPNQYYSDRLSNIRNF